jgi:hypothetical protein
MYTIKEMPPPSVFPDRKPDSLSSRGAGAGRAIAPLYVALIAFVGAAPWVHAGRAKKSALTAWLVLLLGIQVASPVSRSIVRSTSESERDVAAFLAGHGRSAQLILGNVWSRAIPGAGPIVILACVPESGPTSL